MATKKSRSRTPNNNIRISKPKSKSDINKIQKINKGLRKGKLDPKKLPSFLKTRVNGKVEDPLTMQNENTQSFFWNDKNGRSMLVRRNNDSSNLDNDINLVIESMMNSPLSKLGNNEWPSKLIIELGPNDTARAIKNKIEQIDPELADRLQLIGGGKSGQVFTDMVETLESASKDRFKNKAYREVLFLLERGIELENAADTLDNVDKQIKVLDYIDARIKKAKSSDRLNKDERNAALENLKAKLDAQRKDLMVDFEKKLGTAKRTPTEVLIHLLHEVDQSPEINNNPNVKAILKSNLQNKILQHDLTLDSTHQLLNSVKNFLEASNGGELAKLTETLTKQLPDQSKGQKLEPTRLQDNIYGRVFDSAIVNRLVDNPPAEVTLSMKNSAKAMKNLIEANGDIDKAKWETIAGIFKLYLTEGNNGSDVRFWFPKTPAIAKIANSSNDQETLKALIAFLDNPGDNGQALIAIPYVLVKLSLVAKGLQTDGSLSPWMIEANKNYSVITKEVGRDALIRSPDPGVIFQKVDHKPTEGSGINLRHQPNPFVDANLQPSVRPTLKNMPNLNKFNKDGTRRDFPTETVETALEHGLPFGSGASGSTNIMVHMLKDLQKVDPTIDTNAYLLGTMMFLTYDGGHSLQEALWTANQTDKKLGLGLNIGDPDQPNKFVADYQKFAKLFQGTQTGPILDNVMDSALKDTTDYFKDYSVYSKDRKPLPPPQFPNHIYGPLTNLNVATV